MRTLLPEDKESLCLIDPDPTPLESSCARRLQVLVVDDDQMIRLVLEGYLAKWGHEVTSAAAVDRALELLAENPPFDIILSDWVMPETDGLEFAQIARRLHPAVKFILITGFSAKLRAANPLGVDLVMTKPASFEEIGESLKQVLSRPASLLPELDV